MALETRPLPRGVYAGRRHRLAAGMGRLLLRAFAWGLALLALGLLVQALVGWGQHQVDTLRYGFPRRAHLTAYVGHGDERRMPTHIIALNLGGQIRTLVLPGGDASQVAVLPGPYIVGEDGPYAVALPRLADVDGDTHMDLIVTVRNEEIVYTNRDGGFVLLTPEEQMVIQEQGGG